MNASTWKTWLCVACLVLFGAAPAAAQPAELFISEYIEGTSNNKAIEIFNGTGQHIDLAAGGYNLQFFFNGGTTAGTTIYLTGTVGACDVYIVANALASAPILTLADLTSNASWYNGDDLIVLRKGTTIIDSIGQLGVDPGTEWGSGLASTADNTLRRKASITAGDAIATNAFDPALEWDGYATDTFDGLGVHDGYCASGSAVVVTCGPTLFVLQGTPATRDVTATDADGIVTSLDLTSVTPEPPDGTISRTAFTPAAALDGTATATITVDSVVPVGGYDVLMTAANNDGIPETGSCTFTVSVIEPIEIWEIQGSGPASPLVDQVVRTEDNIVTALGFSAGVANGFFIQTPDARADASAETSNGIFVYTGSVPAVQVGDQVDVTGTVSEYYDMTELGDATFTVDSSGNILPAAALLTEIAPGVFVPSHNQPWPVNELERFESMRVRVEDGRATAPTDEYGDLAIVASATRAFREPGITYPGDPSYPVVWDGNPEIFEVNPDGAGLPDLTLPAGSIIHVAEGPLVYSFSDYQIWPTTFTYTAAALPRPVRARQPGELTVASQNMLRFFDANPANGPDDGTPSAADYQARLVKASRHIRTVLGAPDVLSLQEIENVGVLNDLAARIAVDAPSVLYSAYLLEGRDIGGIDTGFLVRNTVEVDSVTQVGYDTTLSLDGSWLNDRPPLVLQARYVANGMPFPFVVIGVHGRSLSGIEDAEANRVRQKRLEQSLELAAYVQSLQAADPTRRIVVTGDFNAYQFSDGYVDVVGIVSGNLDPNGALQDGHADLVNPDLANRLADLPSGERYSYVFDGSAQALDHTLTSAGLAAFVRDFAFTRGNADAPAEDQADPEAVLGTSDHDGLVLFIMTDRDGDGVPDDLDSQPVATWDLTGDGTSDILWRHTTGGDLWVWGIEAAAHALDAYVGTVADANWEIRGQGDLNGDGTADLVWRNKATGAVYLWTMNAGAPSGAAYVATVDLAYDIAGVGDFDGDGMADLLWRNPTQGDVWIWLMNGAAVLSQTYVDTVDLSYTVKGLGDVNGDTRTDVVWAGTAGDIWVWLMNGAVRDTQAYVGTEADPTYQIQQVADFDGNGLADLLWWNTVQGDVWLWTVSGAGAPSAHYVATVSDTNYRIMAAGDYNGDRKADLLWRNIVAGDVWVWLMNGPAKLSEAYVGIVSDLGYQIVK